MLENRLVIHTFSFAHHGRFSSYHHLKDFLPEARVFDGTLRLPRWLPARIRAAISRRWLQRLERQLSHFLATSERQVIHSFYPENSLFTLSARKGAHKLVLTCHQPGEFLRSLAPNHPFLQAVQVADALVLLSENSVEDYRQIAPTALIKVIPHGVDTGFWQATHTGNAKNMVLTVGNWLRDLPAWARVAETLTSMDPKIEFALVASRESIREAAGYLAKPKPHVSFYAGVGDEELKSLYLRSAVSFIPLKGAEANNAVLESLAMRVPLVLSDLPALRYYADDAAEYVDHRDAHHTAGVISALLSDSDRRASMARDGRMLAETRLAWPKIADQLRDLYAALGASPV